MDTFNVAYIAKQALLMSLVLSAPVVAVASIVGLLFSLFQALTQIQDQTVSFAIKLTSVMVVIYATADWTAGKLYAFTIMLYNSI
jgi:type III secretion protein S